MHQPHASVTLGACPSTDSEQMRTVVEANGLVLATAAMSHHKGDAGMQEAGCGMITLLAVKYKAGVCLVVPAVAVWP